MIERLVSYDSYISVHFVPDYAGVRPRFRVNIDNFIADWRPQEAFFRENSQYLRDVGEVEERFRPLLPSTPPTPPSKRRTVWEHLLSGD